MKIRIQGDIHFEFFRGLEFNNFINYQKKIQNKNPCQIIILAGDIVTFDTKNLLHHYLEFLNSHYEKVLYILGNHEYYDNSLKYHFKEGWAEYVESEYVKIVNQFDKVKLLIDEKVEIEGYNFYGTTLWSPIDKKGYYMMSEKLFFEREEILEMHLKCKTKCLDFLKNNENKVLITHHLPSDYFIAPKFQDWNNSGFNADCEEFFDYGMKYWIYGHTHEGKEDFFKGCQTYCYPYGYPRENGKKVGNYDNIFELKKIE